MAAGLSSPFFHCSWNRSSSSSSSSRSTSGCLSSRLPVQWIRYSVSCGAKPRNFRSNPRRQQNKKLFVEHNPSNEDLIQVDDEGNVIKSIPDEPFKSDPNVSFDGSAPESTGEGMGINPYGSTSIYDNTSPSEFTAEGQPIDEFQSSGRDETIERPTGKTGEITANAETGTSWSMMEDEVGSNVSTYELEIKERGSEIHAPMVIDESMEGPEIDPGGSDEEVELTRLVEVNNDGGVENLEIVELEDLLEMIRNAERNILILNRACIRAFKDVDKILDKKEALQGEINTLELKLAEADARLKVAAQQKVSIEILGDQLKKMKQEMSKRTLMDNELWSKETKPDAQELESVLVPAAIFSSLTVEVEAVRLENRSLKCDVELLKLKVAEASEIAQRLVGLEKAKISSEAVFGALESNLATVNDNIYEEMEAFKLENTSLRDDIELLKYKIDESRVTSKQVLALQNGQFSSKAALGVLESKVDAIKQNATDELESLKVENKSLKSDIEFLKLKLAEAQKTGEHLLELEKEQSSSKDALRALGSQLAGVKENMSEVTMLKSGYKILQNKIENLQELLDTTSKLANRTVNIVQEHYALQKKVDDMIASLEEVKAHKLPSEESDDYNKVLEQQVRILEDRLLKSDLEVKAQVHLYRDSVKEFQDTLGRMKEVIDKRRLDEPVDDMPWEFWSHLLLCLDGWLLEKKIASNDAKLLREMAWKRDARIRDVFMACKDKEEKEAVSAFLKLVSTRARPGLHVVHIAAEMAPVAKVGGLADVVSGLGKALQKRGHLVEVILPKYDCMQYNKIDNLKALDVEVESYFDGQLYKNKVWVGIIEGLPVYFIEPYHPAKFFWRGKLYGENDDFKRFSYFSRASLEFLLKAGKRPDIIHCHDWQTAFVAPLYWDVYAPKGLNSARVCFTCHNFEYQGTAPASDLASCGLDVNQLNRPDRMQDNFGHHRVNSVKGAIVFSNIVTTVSPTYAQEVRTTEGGHGLHNTLNAHAKKFVGILNGIDTDSWNPAADAYLKFQYTADDIQGKTDNKTALRKHLGLSFVDSRTPLVGCITRLVPQKGVHLIRHAIYQTLELGGQFLLLGWSPIPYIQREFEDIARQFSNHSQIRLILKYDDALSHSIYAASDMFVIPSVFEPCGLTQMIAMRYGSIPIVRRTGGLNDSVFDVDDESIPLQFRNGFTFATADEQGVGSALERAFRHYNAEPEKWQQLLKRAMTIDFSWSSSASQYEELYEKALARARASQRASG